MTEPTTPTTDEIRTGVAEMFRNFAICAGDPEERGIRMGHERFDRWRREYARKLMERAWRQGFEAQGQTHHPGTDIDNPYTKETHR